MGRIAGMHTSARRTAADWTPVGPVTGGQASPGGTPMVMPMAQVLVFPEPGGDYATIGYRGLRPVFTTDGAAVPASAPGRWGQLAAAGRP
jgi:hypothetical protein